MTDDDRSPDSADSPPARKRRMRASDADRDAVLEVLARAHANGRLDVEEVDERQSAVMATKFLDELPAHLEDLPEGQDLAATIVRQVDPEGQGRGRGQGASGAGGPGTDLARRPGAHPPVPRDPHLRDPHLPATFGQMGGDTSLAVLGGKNVTLPEGTTHTQTWALLGGDNVDLTEVLTHPDAEVTMECHTFMGGNNLYVPPGVRIIDRTANVLGGSGIKKNAQGDGSNGTLVLTGVNVLGGSDVKLHRRYPKDANRTAG
ncbi:DUF1707 SHOCT-like domain-containing protein [Brevibacterium litoralis]|uniref:DUF1707 SHOCT-like domain-containing protein n=1 Tax=Brevibacterium litoralis TaxID=3138935 RepID=UPI0032EC0C87